jgi:methionyl-tRNA formyltransferase
MAGILLLGMGSTALSALESLTPACDVVGVVRNVEGGQRDDDPIVTLARALDIPVYTDVAPGAVEALALRLRPDCIVISSYNRILRAELLRQIRCVNVHYAPLPQYRGRANVNWAIINDEPYAAITIHMVAPGLDAGNILFQQQIPIHERDTVANLYATLNAIQREHLAATVLRMLEGYTGEPQHEEDATYGCGRGPEDGEINWHASTRSIDCLIRGLVAPFPGAYTFINSRRLIIWRAEPLQSAPRYAGRIPGRVVGIGRAAGYVDVLTSDGVLRVFEVQLEGEAKTTAASVVTSVRATFGLRMAELLDRIGALEQQIAALVARDTDGIAH